MNQVMTVPDMVHGVGSDCLALIEPHNDVNWQAEANYAIQLICNNDFAAKIAQQNPVSVQNALRNASAIGISLNPASKHAYLIPRKINKQQQICLDISYMGLLHLAMSTGSILWGKAELVYESDKFEITAIDKAPDHARNPFSKDRGQIIGAYCTVKTALGDYLTECMSIDEINGIRARSESFKKGYGPWVSDYTEMCRKTVVKRASKYWPKVDRLDNAIHVLNTDSGEGISDKQHVERDITPPDESQIEKLKRMVEATGTDMSAFVTFLNARTGHDFEEITQFSFEEIKDTAIPALQAKQERMQ